MLPSAGERGLHSVLVLGILLKAFNGAVEIIVGVALIFRLITLHVVVFMFRDELIEDPTDVLASAVRRHVFPFLAHRQRFAAAYLLSHGIVKLALVIGLLQNKLWAYPVAIGVFILFVLYQVYGLSTSPSPFLILLTVFDIAVIVLTWHEYRIVLASSHSTRHPAS